MSYLPTSTSLRSVVALAGAAALTTFGAAAATAETEVSEPSEFTSAFTVNATPDMVVNPDGEAAPGPEGSSGTFMFWINSDEEIICYEITTVGVEPPYESPAKTATHIHESPAGEPGPPRLAFPDPEGSGDTRTSEGCIQGPFTTGLEDDDGVDTAEGFSLAEIESNPSEFYADVHTADFVPGAVRGQLVPMPVGGVDTGEGGASSTSNLTAPVLGTLSVVGLLGLGAWSLTRRKAES